MPSLRCAQDYDVFVVDSETQAVLGRLPWAEIKWQRVSRKISVAEVTVAEWDGGIDCCSIFGGLFPWRQMLRIERDGHFVWDGPITGWGRPSIANAGARGVRIRAHDRFIITQKRLIGADRLFEQETAGTILYTLLTDALVGDIAYDPYPLYYPAAAGITYSTTGDSLVNPDGTLVLFDREYRYSRLETVYDAMTSLVDEAELFYTTKGDTVYMDEAAIRDSMGARGIRPVLNELTCIDLPGIEVDGLNMATVAHVGTQGEGAAGSAMVRYNAFWVGLYVGALLERGRTVQSIQTVVDLHKQAQIDATRNVTPNITVEQVTLSEYFGGPMFNEGLANLMPGVRFDVDIEDSCAFDQVVVDIGWEYRVGYEEADFDQISVYQLTPLISERIETVHLNQLDVTVDVSEGAMREAVKVSCAPTIEWDGDLPTGWPSYLQMLALQ